ncbi:hypothetical protein BDR06DRAFT_1061149 [Suillus hirtellus]|nr:hypothetical protein BDR06DRAFT_1061149 [Suillus hirtellus]
MAWTLGVRELLTHLQRNTQFFTTAPHYSLVFFVGDFHLLLFPGGIEICDLLENILKEIENILTDALTILSCNTDLITDEEQKSFSQEFSRCHPYFVLSPRLINVRVELNKYTAYHRLTEQACATQREENFRIGFLAAAAACEVPAVDTGIRTSHEI